MNQGREAAPASIQVSTEDASIKSKADAQETLVFLYFGNHWFAENRTSSHQIARELARRYRVLYFQCPGLRAPSGTGRDLKKIFDKIWGFLRGPIRVSNNLSVRTLLQLPFHRFRLVRWLNRHLVRVTVRWVMRREKIHSPITWFHIPHLPFLLGSLGERLSVYYCIDDYASFPGVSADVVRQMDDETTRRADLVFIASETLLEHKRPLNDQVQISPHGVEVEHFAKALDPDLPLPPEVARLPRPIIGFFGLIERFIDLDLIDYLARARPHWSFVLLGRVAIPPDQIPRRPNIHFLGQRNYEQLPAFGKAFDVAILPYRKGSWSYHANPIKLREYLAMGKPIVSVETPQMLKFADVIAIAQDRGEFLDHLDQAVAGPPCPESVQRRFNRVRDSSWQHRVDQVLQTLRALLPKT